MSARDAVKVIYAKGAPTISSGGSDERLRCIADMTVSDGDRIVTGKGEAVELAFDKDRLNILKVEEISDVVVKHGSLGGRTSIALMNGTAIALFEKMPPGATIEMRTAAGVGGTRSGRGAGFRSVTDGRSSLFEVYDRTIYAYGVDSAGDPIGETFDIKEGYKVAVEGGSIPDDPERLSGQDYARWNGWKDGPTSRFGAAVIRTSTGIPPNE